MNKLTYLAGLITMSLLVGYSIVIAVHTFGATS